MANIDIPGAYLHTECYEYAMIILKGILEELLEIYSRRYIGSMLQ